MLSYRHSFHAGNFADVLKHIVVVEILQHLRQKDTAFHYIDTHAGAGLFDLQSGYAEKLREHANGVGKLRSAAGRLNEEQWPELGAYFAAINAHNEPASSRFYPGSPLLARHFLRRQDKAWLYELHTSDIEILQGHVGRDRRIRVMHEDGFKGMMALLPPVSRRGLVLIDPSFEIKSDFDRVIATVLAAHKKFATGIYAIWYPVVERRRVGQLEKGICDAGIRNVQRFELAVAADSAAAGMSASGMIVINPPWTLMEKMSQLLPKLVDALAIADGAFCRSDVLVDE